MKRGDIYFVELRNPYGYQNSIETKRRPVVIVSSDIGCRTAPIVMVAPLTTKFKHLSCNVPVRWTYYYRPSQVLCNQLMTIPVDEIKPENFAGFLSEEELRAVNNGVLISLGIVQEYNNKYNKGDNNNA